MNLDCNITKVTLEEYLAKEDFLMLFKACLIEITENEGRLRAWFNLIEDLSVEEAEAFKQKVFFRSGFAITNSKTIKQEEIN